VIAGQYWADFGEEPAIIRKSSCIARTFMKRSHPLRAVELPDEPAMPER
jgi:hypothetical protein